MTIVIYVFAGIYLLLWAAMMGAYFLTRHIGLFLFGLTYGTAGLAAIILTHWWPLVAGLALVWVMRLAGLEPKTQTAPK